MSRRRRQPGPVGDLFDVVASAPWWVGVSLAAISYPLLSEFAKGEVERPSEVGEMASFALAQAGQVVAGFAQYLVPILFLLASLVSFLTRRYRARLYESAVNAQNQLEAIKNMSWREFEILIAEAFRRQGYSSAETRPGADGGVDVRLQRDGRLYLVQCKQYKAKKVSVTVVRELYGVMSAEGASGGFVVTSGHFTKDAWTFTKGKTIQLIDGQRLVEMIQGIEQPGRSQHDEELAERQEVVEDTASSPSCPACGADMVLRKAQRGARAGQSFWGCTKYPACKGLLSNT